MTGVSRRVWTRSLTGLVVLASAVGVWARPAVAGYLEATDARGEVADARGDVTSYGAASFDGQLRVSVTPSSFVQPITSAEWQRGDTAIVVAVDTDGDGNEDGYGVFDAEQRPDGRWITMTHTFAGTGNSAHDCGGVGTSSQSTYYFVQVDLTCLGSPTVVDYAVAFLFDSQPDDPNNEPQVDYAPNEGLWGPVGTGPRPDEGYWLLGADGGVFSFGGAQFYGSTGDRVLNAPVVGMAATTTGKGYWFVATDGGIFSYGDAAFYGSTGAIRLNKPIVGMATTPSGNGYWLVATDGGLFAFGDAGFFGSTGNIILNRPIVGMATTPSGKGYWLVADDGGLFAFGDAAFFGSTGNIALSQSIVGMASTPSGHGYELVSRDGGLFAFGDARYLGSMAGQTRWGSVVGIAGDPDGGYTMVTDQGQVLARGAAEWYHDLITVKLTKPIVGLAVMVPTA